MARRSGCGRLGGARAAACRYAGARAAACRYEADIRRSGLIRTPASAKGMARADGASGCTAAKPAPPISEQAGDPPPSPPPTATGTSCQIQPGPACAPCLSLRSAAACRARRCGVPGDSLSGVYRDGVPAASAFGIGAHPSSRRSHPSLRVATQSLMLLHTRPQAVLRAAMSGCGEAGSAQLRPDTAEPKIRHQPRP